MTTATESLRDLLARPGLIVMPCCHDAFSARLIERAGFPLTFMSGFTVSAARLGLPDTGLISYGEMAGQGRDICAAVSIPVIGDADTGYGNAFNVKRTVRGYAAAGFAGIMIEDQVAPKRCGHTQGKQVADRGEAFSRIRAAVDAREELRGANADMVIMARTDARATHDMDEALARCREFQRLGADIIFLEAPQSADEMQRFCEEIPGPKLANMLEQGATPILPPAELEAMGYTIAAYPLTLLLASQRAMEAALAALKDGHEPQGLATFEELKDAAGFPEYFKAEQDYKDED